jgi:hypothetical protein
MLETPVPLSNYPLPVKKKSGSHTTLFDLDQEEDADIDIHSQSNGAVMPETYDDDDDLDMASGGGKERGKSRRELPAGAVATLKAWLLSPEHFTHPYPTPQDQAMLMQKTGIDKKQLKNWFTNARRRIWKPMLKKQIEQGNLTSTGVQGIPGSVPGLMMPNMPGGASAGTSGLGNPHSIQAMRTHYQQAVGQTQQQQQQQQQQVRDSNSFRIVKTIRIRLMATNCFESFLNKILNTSSTSSKQSMLTETQSITKGWNSILGNTTHKLRSLHSSSTKWRRALRSERFPSYCRASRSTRRTVMLF